MNKRSKLIMVISVVLVVALLSTLFVGCKDKDKNDTPAPTPTPEETLKATDVLDAAVEAYKAAGFEETALSNLKFAFNLGMKGSVNGGTEKNYSLKVLVGFNLVDSLKNGYADNYIDLVTKEENVETFRFYYRNGQIPADQLEAANAAEKYPDRAYIKAGDKKYTINVPNVAFSMQKEMIRGAIGINPTDQEITDGTYKHWIDDIAIQDFLNNDLPGYLNMAVGLIGKDPVYNEAAGTGSFSVPLSELLKTTGELGGVLGEFAPKINNYLKQVGLKTDLGNLLDNVIPAIDLNIAFTGMKAGETPSTVITATVGKDNNNMTIDMADDATKGIFFVAPKCNGTLTLDVATGAYAENISNIDANTYPATPINPINFTLGGSLAFDSAVNLSLADGVIKINIPKGAKYDIEVALDLNPTAFLGGTIDFTGKKVMEELLNIVTNENLINYAKIALTPTKNSAENTLPLTLEVFKDGETLLAKLDASLLGMGKFGEPAGMDLGGLIESVKGMFSKTAANETAADAQLEATLKDVKNALLGLRLDVNLTEGQEKAEATFAERKFATKIGDGSFDMDKQWLSLAITKVTVDKNGFAVQGLQIKTGGSLLENTDPEKDKCLDINVSLNIDFNSFGFGTAVQPE